jgi:hypothetical protein
MLANAMWAGMFQMPQIAIIMGGLTAMVIALGMTWYRVEKVRSNNELKRSLVERGLSVEEIERIVEAGQKEEQ